MQLTKVTQKILQTLHTISTHWIQSLTNFNDVTSLKSKEELGKAYHQLFQQLKCE